jgi:hypothetical protein
MKTTALLMLLIATAAQAQGMKLFPLWDERQCPKDTYACYTFDQAKTIVKLDLELQFKLKELEACTTDRVDLNLAIEKLRLASLEDKKSIDLLTTRLDEKQKALVTAARIAAKAEGQSIFHYLPWIVVGVVVVAGGTFVLGWAVGAHAL